MIVRLIYDAATLTLGASLTALLMTRDFWGTVLMLVVIGVLFGVCRQAVFVRRVSDRSRPLTRETKCRIH